MPPSTSSSVIRSAFFRPTCGRLFSVLSILVTSTGRSGVAPLTGSPVSGHRAASSVPPATGWESGLSALLSLLPPPQAASVADRRTAVRTAVKRAELALDARARANMCVSMARRAPRSAHGPPLSTVNSRVSDLGTAVDVQRLAGDVRRLVAAQERSRRGDVLGGRDPVDRVGLGSGG